MLDAIDVEEALPFRLADGASKRATHRWIDEHVVAHDNFSFPALEQCSRALDVLNADKATPVTAVAIGPRS